MNQWLFLALLFNALTVHDIFINSTQFWVINISFAAQPEKINTQHHKKTAQLCLRKERTAPAHTVSYIIQSHWHVSKKNPPGNVLTLCFRVWPSLVLLSALFCFATADFSPSNLSLASLASAAHSSWATGFHSFAVVAFYPFHYF